MAAKKKAAPKRAVGKRAPEGAKFERSATAPQAKTGRAGLSVTLILVAALVGLGVQSFYVARAKAAMKYDFVRAGAIISQGLSDGQATGPTALAFDPQGNIFFLDGQERSEMRLQKFDRHEGFLGKYKPVRAEQVLGRAVAMDVDAEGGLYVLKAEGSILEMDNNLKFKDVVQVKVGDPDALAVGPDGKLYVASHSANKVQVFSADGGVMTEFGGAGTHSGDLASPVGLCFDGAGNLAVLEDLPDTPRVKVFDKNLKLQKSFRLLGLHLTPSTRIAADNQGRLFLNDPAGDSGIRVYNLDNGKQTGQVLGTAQGDLFVSPGAVGADRFTGTVYVHTIPGLIPCVVPVGH
jgi:DNA-binding beta-propeller fold protein YncE